MNEQEEIEILKERVKQLEENQMSLGKEIGEPTGISTFIWFQTIYRCSKCGKEYKQLEQFKKRDFPGIRIYYTPCCDTANVELIEKREE